MTRPPAAPERALAPLPPDVLEALEKGQTIEAIKRLRRATGLGLKEAKDLVDARSREQSAAFGRDRDRAPGEVPRRAGAGWVVLVLAFLAVLLVLRRLFADPG